MHDISKYRNQNYSNKLVESANWQINNQMHAKLYKFGIKYGHRKNTEKMMDGEKYKKIT